MKRVENAGEGGNEKAFEMLSDFWSDLSLHLPCILPFCSFAVSDWQHSSVCLVACSSYQLTARVPS